MLYLVTYEINKNKDHSSLFETIKDCGVWWHYLDSTWIIKTDKTASEIQDKLRPHIDKVDDSILIIKIDPKHRAGLLPRKAWNWLKRNE